ncbi:MAG: AAA family ATPase, partial [Anaerolineae bacterium]|nr:AAA family ATPase [Anaerolineae bacterium]
MEALLLQTKLYIPPPRSGLIARPRLIEQLTEGLSLGRKLTLISAPAGFGKTTLISSWLGQIDRPTTWLSLDDNDNDPNRFLTYLVAALQRVAPKIGEEVLALLHTTQLQPALTDSILTALLNDILSLPEPFVLVLDDYHVLESPPIDRALT